MTEPCLYCREHFEEAMKYARHSVSDQDIRHYEMFSQVRVLSCSCCRHHCHDLIWTYRTCSNLVALEMTSSSPMVTLLPAVRLPQQVAMQDSSLQTTRRMTICTHKEHRWSGLRQYTSVFHRFGPPSSWMSRSPDLYSSSQRTLASVDLKAAFNKSPVSAD